MMIGIFKADHGLKVGIRGIKLTHQPFSVYIGTLFFDDNFGFFCFGSILKGALKGLRQFLITESPLKIMKSAFYFTLKALFLPMIFKFLT